MTGLFSAQYFLIFFMMVGLCCSRPFVSRLAFSAVTFAIGRFMVRSVTNWMWGAENPFGNIIGSDLVIISTNFGVLFILVAELVTGHKEKSKKRILVKSSE